MKPKVSSLGKANMMPEKCQTPIYKGGNGLDQPIPSRHSHLVDAFGRCIQSMLVPVTRVLACGEMGGSE